MDRRVSEFDIEAYFVERVDALGGEAQKIDVRGRRGRCDRFASFPIKASPMPVALFYFVELKAVNGATKPWQFREHRRLAERGFVVRVLYSKMDVDAFIRNVEMRLAVLSNLTP